MAVPNTTTRLSHALTIRARGRTIGAIRSWSPNMRRTIDTEFDVDASANGMPIDLVPQAVDTREVRLSRYDLYLSLLEEVFGTTELVVLSDQVRPFSIREVWRGPSTLLQVNTGVLGGLANLISPASASADPVAAELRRGANALRGGQRTVDEAVTRAATSKVGAPVVTALGTFARDQRIYEYTGCYFTDIGRNMESSGDRTVFADATLVWLQRHRIV